MRNYWLQWLSYAVLYTVHRSIAWAHSGHWFCQEMSYLQSVIWGVSLWRHPGTLKWDEETDTGRYRVRLEIASKTYNYEYIQTKLLPVLLDKPRPYLCIHPDCILHLWVILRCKWDWLITEITPLISYMSRETPPPSPPTHTALPHTYVISGWRQSALIRSLRIWSWDKIVQWASSIWIWVVLSWLGGYLLDCITSPAAWLER